MAAKWPCMGGSLASSAGAELVDLGSLLISTAGVFDFEICDENSRLRVMEPNPTVRNDDISGDGGTEVDGAPSAFASRRLRFLVLLPLEEVTWLER